MRLIFDGEPEPPSRCGYTRRCPFGCVESGLLSLLTFLPGQAMRPHRHLDSEEYFTALSGDIDMLVDGEQVLLPHGSTFLRRRGVLHALRNHGSRIVVVQSFQSPIPADSMIRWETASGWGQAMDGACPRCWCGHVEAGCCANCGLSVTRYNGAKARGARDDGGARAGATRRGSQTGSREE